jgi:hypothetical protein
VGGGVAARPPPMQRKIIYVQLNKESLLESKIRLWNIH